MKDRRIVIVGFMGSGKTTVAEVLARQLDCDAIDLDAFIKEREGRSPAEIIAQDGEPAFRQIETDALLAVLEKKEVRVIALGGGAWTVNANRTIVAEYDCLSIWLDAPFEICWQRITSSGTVRPLAPTRESAQRLYRERGAHYKLATLRVDVFEEESAEVMAAGIVRALR